MPASMVDLKQRPMLSMDRFDFHSFIRDVASVRKAVKTGTVEIHIDFEVIDNESMNEFARRVEDSFQRKTKEAGIERVRFLLS